MGWLHGYSGGMLRMPHLRILPNQMRALRNGFAASGFTRARKRRRASTPAASRPMSRAPEAMLAGAMP